MELFRSFKSEVDATIDVLAGKFLEQVDAVNNEIVNDGLGRQDDVCCRHGVNCDVFLRYASARQDSSHDGADHSRWVNARWLSTRNDAVRPKVVAIRLFLHVELSSK